jgi:glucokinase
MKYVLGIDLGGTNVKGVALAENGDVVLQHYLSTQDTGDGSWRVNIQAMADYLRQQLGHPVAGIGISAPGLANATNRCIAFLPNRLAGLENFVWADYLNEPNTWVLNDAHAALMAEARFGAARNRQHVVLLTLGTGVGGGLLIDGQLYQGLNQMAGHLGHLSIDADSHELSIVGAPGSLEFAIGNYSVPARTHGRFQSTADLVVAYQAGDHFATLIWLTSVRRLAAAVVSLSNALSPELVVLSGGITLAGEALFAPLQSFLDVYEWRPGGKQTPIVQAQFADLAGAVGAGAFTLMRKAE